MRYTILVILTLILIQGCTYQNWYTGIKDHQRQECYKLPSGAEVQQCLERNSMDYDSYKLEREKRMSNQVK